MGNACKAWEHARAVLPCRQVHDTDAGGDGEDEPRVRKDTPVPDKTGTPDPPDGVKPVPRLVSDVKYLVELLDLEVAPRQRMRAKNLSCLYLPGDASGSGFGSAVIGEDGIEYKAGTWNQDFYPADQVVCLPEVRRFLSPVLFPCYSLVLNSILSDHRQFKA